MKSVHRNIKYLVIAFLMFSGAACEEEFYYETPPPRQPQQTSTLEAIYVTTAPSTINSSYWKSADYLKVTASNVSTQLLYGDGLLNMTGIYDGLSSFNNGADPGLTLKAAYDENNLYILAEWTDTDINVSNSSWLFGGPVDPKKTDSNSDWTSQRNCDKIAFAFEISSATSPAGNFSSKGCAASCHTGSGGPVMYPSSGTVDIWNWSLARSAPMGYAEDLVATADSFSTDSGQKISYRNVAGTTDRSGPAYEWDGTSQSISLPSGQNGILDPGFYLLNKQPFSGDAYKGDSIFHTPVPPGDCASCHGENGEGGSATVLNLISSNKKTRAALIAGMDNVPDMAPYWGTLTPDEKNDVVAYLRGLSGVPGYYLNTPTESNADLKAVSNVTPVQIVDAMLPATNQHTKYQVLITRKLNTNNNDDKQFNLLSSKVYRFGVALMDDDGINHVGSIVETLTFK